MLKIGKHISIKPRKGMSSLDQKDERRWFIAVNKTVREALLAINRHVRGHGILDNEAYGSNEVYLCTERELNEAASRARQDGHKDGYRHGLQAGKKQAMDRLSDALLQLIEDGEDA